MPFGRRYLSDQIVQEKIWRDKWVSGYSLGTVPKDAMILKEEIFTREMRSTVQYLRGDHFINFENMTLPQIEINLYNPAQQCCIVFESVYDLLENKPLTDEESKYFASVDEKEEEIDDLRVKLARKTGYSAATKAKRTTLSHATRVITKEMIDYARKHDKIQGNDFASPIFLTCDNSVSETQSLYDLFKLRDPRNAGIELTQREQFIVHLPVYKLEKIVCNLWKFLYFSLSSFF